LSRDPFLGDIDWPGREVRPSAGESRGDEGSGRGEAPGDLIPEDRQKSVTSALEAARQAAGKLEEESLQALDEELNVPTEDLPQTAEAAQILAGTHPSFGHTRPEVPEEEKLQAGNLNAQIFDRAYKTLEHADRAALGFDMQEMAFSGSPGEARPFGSIESPATAAGEKDPRDPGAETQGPEQISQEKTQTQKKSIWKRLFEAVVPFIFRLVAGIFNAMGQQAEQLLSFSVGGVTIGVGKYVAKPYYWIRDLFRDLAEQMMDRAMGRSASRKKPEEPPPPEGPVPGEEENVNLGPETPDQQYREYAEYDPTYGGESGRRFLEAAQQALRTAEREVQRSGNRKLAQAMRQYESAREMHRVLDAHDAMADAWGAGRPSPVDIEPPGESQPAEVREEIREQLPFECN
jgi:hypothetical protein